MALMAGKMTSSIFRCRVNLPPVGSMQWSYVGSMAGRSVPRMIMMCRNMAAQTSTEFVIRRMISPKEVQYSIDLAAKEGWRPGKDDAKCFYFTDPTGFFVGELDGKIITTMSVCKYDEKLAFAGLYIVEEEYRGMGYGIKTFNAALGSVDRNLYNLGLDAVVERSHLYHEKDGFKKAWTNRRFEIDPINVLEYTKTVPPCSDVMIKPITEVNFSQLADYDTVMFGVPRHAFLKQWIVASHARGFAAVDSSGELLGYTVIRKMLVDGEGYKIGPLFANSSDAALSLFVAAIEFTSATPNDRNVLIDVPIDLNAQAVELIEKCKGVPVFTTYRMYTKEKPNLPGSRIFGITTFELG